MKKIKIVSIASIAIVGLAVSLLIQHRSRIKFLEKEALLQERDGQLTALSSENTRLSNSVAHAENATRDDHVTELSKLRSKAETLKKQTNDLGRQIEEKSKPQSSGAVPAEQPHPPEYWEQLHQMAGAKGTDARNLASAMIQYASDHQNQFPTNLDQMVSYLSKANLAPSGTNQFEIVFHGSLDSLHGVSMGAVALIRDQQTFQGPDGKIMRVYGMATGVGEIVGSDDNFATWESQHVISPPRIGQSGQ
jgi:hypothetical protein